MKLSLSSCKYAQKILNILSKGLAKKSDWLLIGSDWVTLIGPCGNHLIAPHFTMSKILCSWEVIGKELKILLCWMWLTLDTRICFFSIF
jgi:hypothetical protein